MFSDYLKLCSQKNDGSDNDVLSLNNFLKTSSICNIYVAKMVGSTVVFSFFFNLVTCFCLLPICL